MSGLIIEGGDRWRVPARGDDAKRMASYIERVGDVPGRCADCAFREGSEASKSRLVAHLIEMCLGDENNNFCCHHGEPDRPCAGFTALRDSLALVADSATEARGEHAPSHPNEQTVVSLLPDQTARET